MISLAGMQNWNPWMIMPQLVGIIVTTLIITIIAFIYYKKVKKMAPDEDPRGIVLLVELIIKYIEKIVVDVWGIKYKNLTIYLMYLIFYILIGNWISVIGLESQVTSYTVTLSLGLVTFIGMYYLAIKFQKLMFLKKYIVNPLELLTQFAPLVSISFRLFGNITGGSIITLLLYNLTQSIWGHIPVIGQVNFLIGTVGPFIHIYFDLFDGSIQALIFGILTIVYWKLQIEVEGNSKSDLEIKVPKKIRKDKIREAKNTNNQDLIYSERNTY